MKKRHINIPIFIPHEGCPNNCVFCNQHTITQTSDGGSARDITKEIESCLATIDTDACECEIAFFGGSFTGSPREDMVRLLGTAHKYIRDGIEPPAETKAKIDRLHHINQFKLELMPCLVNSFSRPDL